MGESEKGSGSKDEKGRGWDLDAKGRGGQGWVGESLVVLGWDGFGSSVGVEVDASGWDADAVGREEEVEAAAEGAGGGGGEAKGD